MVTSSPRLVKPSHRERDRSAPASLAVHLGSLPIAAAVILWFNRGQWFFGDEWDFLDSRLDGGLRVLFLPHNEHWSTVPILIYRALYAAFGLRSYLPYMAVVVAMHLVVAHLLWRLMRRSGVAPVVATGLAVVFSVLGAGAENLLWAFQMSFVGAVAVGLAHLLVVDHPGGFGRRDAVGWALSVLALMFSGIGVTMTLTSGLCVLLRRGARAAILTVAPPGAVFLLWFRWLGDEGLASHERTLDSLLQVPQYVWRGLSHGLEQSFGIPAAGAALVLVVLVWLLRQPDIRHPRAAAPTGMAIGAVCLFVVLGVGRSALGIEQATESRYVYVTFALLLPTLGRMLSEASLGLVSRQLAVAAFLFFPLVHNIAELRRESRLESALELPVRDQIVAAARLAGSDAPLIGVLPDPKWSPNLTIDGLLRLQRQGALPDVAVTETDTLAAATQLQVAELDGPMSPDDPQRRPTVVPGSAVAFDGVGCANVRPPPGAPARLQLQFGVPSRFAVVSPTGGELEIALRSSVDPAVVGPARTIAFAPGTTWIGVSRVGTVDLTVLNAPDAQLCGIRVIG